MMLSVPGPNVATPPPFDAVPAVRCTYASVRSPALMTLPPLAFEYPPLSVTKLIRTDCVPGATLKIREFVAPVRVIVVVRGAPSPVITTESSIGISPWLTA